MLKPYLETALEVSKSDLRAGKQIRLRVNGRSMAPSLLPGDNVVVEQVAADRLSIGDLIVVRSEHGLVTHRLVGNEGNIWYLKGDSFYHIDPPVESHSIIGKVVAVERSGSIINMCNPYWERVNHFLGRLGWWQASVYKFGLKYKNSMFGRKAPVWTSKLVTISMLPFRIPIMIIIGSRR